MQRGQCCHSPLTLRISRSATVPGRKRCGFFTPPMVGALLRAVLIVRVVLGAGRPVGWVGWGRRWCPGDQGPTALRAVALMRTMAAGGLVWRV